MARCSISLLVCGRQRNIMASKKSFLQLYYYDYLAAQSCFLANFPNSRVMSLKMGQINSTLRCLSLKSYQIVLSNSVAENCRFFTRKNWCIYFYDKGAVSTMRSSSRVFLKCFCTTNAQASASGKSLFNWQLLTTLIWPITNTFKTLWKWKSKGAESQIISLWSNFLREKRRDFR